MSAQDPVAGTEVNDLHRARAVRWLSPTELGRAALKVLLGSQFGQYVDKRETQQGPAFEQGPYFDHSNTAAGEEFWLDYVSDIGDGFDATYSVASLLATDLKGVDGSSGDLQRGAVLVMGGDEVYPTGDVRNYKQRTTDVYRAALPESAEPRPTIYAVPGNHDWYDGLTAFLRTFGQDSDIGGWETQQRRSYFALKLPHRWWLFGLDIQLNTYIDRPQLEYFRRVGKQMAEGDQVILCTAKPAWYASDAEQTAGMAHLTYFLKYTLAGRGIRIPLVLTGDSHHYARYSVDGDCPQTLVTAGHGGAFLSTTQQLRPVLPVPNRLRDPVAPSDETSAYHLDQAWPDVGESGGLARGILWRLLLRNGLLPVLFAVLQALFVAAFVWPSWPMVLGLLVFTFGGSIAFARASSGSAWAKLGWGLVLGLLNIGLSCGLAAGCWALVNDESWYVELVGVFVAGAIGGVLTAELLAIWLLIAGWAGGVCLNELFAGQSIEDYKGFLRLRIDRDGNIMLYPIGIEHAVHDWVPGSDGGPVLVPAPGQSLDPVLLEAPIQIAAPAPSGVESQPSVGGGA
jgi:hypothetical protein